MLENLAFFHNSSKTPDDADIANRKHYSAPAGALTKFFVATCNCACVAKSPHLVVFQITGCLVAKCLCTGFASPSVRFGIFKGLLSVWPQV